VERGVVLGLVERFKASNKYITDDYRRAAERLLKELADQTTPITARAPGESDADFIKRLGQPKPMRKCTEPPEPMSTEFRRELEQSYWPPKHPPGSRAAIEAAVNSVEGVRECIISYEPELYSIKVVVKPVIKDACSKLFSDTWNAVHRVLPLGIGLIVNVLLN
jgi:hypothetical protein